MEYISKTFTRGVGRDLNKIEFTKNLLFDEGDKNVFFRFSHHLFIYTIILVNDSNYIGNF